MDYSDTLMLYMVVIFISFLLAFKSQRMVQEKNIIYRTNKLLFIFSFIIPWFFLSFAGMSNDYEEYKHIYTVVEWNNFNKIWIEPGYAFINLLIKTFIDTPEYGIIIIKTISISLVFKTIYDYKERIPLGLAVLGYLSSYYLDSFCMVRIHLAAGLILYAWARYDLKNNIISSFILLLVAISVHYSAFIVIFCICGYIYCMQKKKFSFLRFFQLCLSLLLSIPFIEYFFNYLIYKVTILTKYGNKYKFITNSGGTGLFQIFFHMPLIFIFHQLQKRIKFTGNNDQKTCTIGCILAIFSFYFMYLGYKIEVINRTFVYFMYLWIITIPLFYRVRLEQKIRDSYLIYILILTLFLIKLYVYINSDSLTSSGINKFYFLWEK